MIKRFPHLTNQIKGKTIIEQPFVIFGDKVKDTDTFPIYYLLVFSDGFYSIIGIDETGDIDFLREKDLPTDIKNILLKNGMLKLSMQLCKKL